MLVFSLLLLACWMDDSRYLSERALFLDEDADGFTPNDGDCDDSNPMLHPNADEVCDGVDNNCDGLLDEEPVSGPLWYIESATGCFDLVLISCIEPEVPFQSESEQCE
jgi:hypothetical protein